MKFKITLFRYVDLVYGKFISAEDFDDTDLVKMTDGWIGLSSHVLYYPGKNSASWGKSFCQRYFSSEEAHACAAKLKADVEMINKCKIMLNSETHVLGGEELKVWLKRNGSKIVLRIIKQSETLRGVEEIWENSGLQICSIDTPEFRPSRLFIRGINKVEDNRVLEYTYSSVEQALRFIDLLIIGLKSINGIDNIIEFPEIERYL